MLTNHHVKVGIMRMKINYYYTFEYQAQRQKQRITTTFGLKKTSKYAVYQNDIIKYA